MQLQSLLAHIVTIVALSAWLICGSGAAVGAGKDGGKDGGKAGGKIVANNNATGTFSCSDGTSVSGKNAAGKLKMATYNPKSGCKSCKAVVTTTKSGAAGSTSSTVLSCDLAASCPTNNATKTKVECVTTGTTKKCCCATAMCNKKWKPTAIKAAMRSTEVGGVLLIALCATLL